MTHAPSTPISGNGLRHVPAGLLGELADAAYRAGFMVSHVALAQVQDKPGLLAACAQGLQFPEGIGGNFDALADALTDLSWLDSTAHAIIIDGAQHLRLSQPGHWQSLLEIIDEAATQWTQAGQAFQVFVADEPMPGSPSGAALLIG